jgi:inner membrane protein
MEPVTHFLTGACIGRAGLNRKTKYATLVAVLAAEAADIDILWGLRGPVESLKHHRGITHTFLAVPLVAGAAVGVVWLLDRWWERQLARKAEAFHQNAKTLPVRWGWLYLTAMIAALSHIALDWTNNYGVRPFFPINAHWYAGSLVFIAEPLEWALLLVALTVPWLLGLVAGEIGARRTQFRGRGWAIFALVGIGLLCCWRWVEQTEARSLIESTQVATAAVKRIGLEPYPLNPYRWHAILETADYFQTAEVNIWTGEIVSDPHRDVIYKPAADAAVEVAKRTPLGQVFLDWGRWAVVRDVGQVTAPGMDPPQLPPGRLWTTVEFDDLRFDYSYLGAERKQTQSPLSGWVYVIDGRDDAGESLHGREQQ